jgi:CRISPR/Cas system-associated exonuclease Cas4 (RecB family)
MVSKILKLQNGASFDDFLNRLEDSYAEVARLLSEIRQKVMKMPRKMYGQFYQYLKSQYDTEHVVMAYDEWMMKEGDDTFETLKGKQTLEVAKPLRKGLLGFQRTPIQNEIDKVDINKIIYWMPCDYDRKYLMSDDFRIQCAKFRKFNSWKGDILKLDYEALGKHLFQYYYKMTDEDRQAFFDLDIMVELINKDIAKVMPKNEEDGPDDEIDIEELTERLKPIFYNNKDDVEIFLKEIKGMSPNDITDLVNRWVKEKRISEYGNSRKGDLWTMLNDAGLYTKSRQNWNRRVY